MKNLKKIMIIKFDYLRTMMAIRLHMSSTSIFWNFVGSSEVDWV